MKNNLKQPENKQIVPLSKADIQKVALYIAFGVRFDRLNSTSMLSSEPSVGFLGNTVIHKCDEDLELEDYTHLNHAQNVTAPALRLLENMTDEEFKDFEKLTMLHNVTKQEMAEHVLKSLTPELLVYCLSKWFDLFNFVKDGKAVELETTRYYQAMMKSRPSA